MCSPFLSPKIFHPIFATMTLTVNLFSGVKSFCA